MSTPRKQTSVSPVNSTRKHQVSSSSPPRVLEEPAYPYEPIPHSYLYETEMNKSFYQQQPLHHRFNGISDSPPQHSIHHQHTIEQLHDVQEENDTDDDFETPVVEKESKVVEENQPLQKNGSQIFMEVDDCEYEDLDDEDDDMTIDDAPPLKIRKTVLPSISQLYSTPSPSTYYQPSFPTYCPPPLSIHHCGYEPLSRSSLHDTKFKAFCEFVLKNESYVI
jgi:hypothetical protein